ncbi:MAG: hypothetical protein ACQEP8_06170 [Chlamydiota bacterium]
MRKEQKSSSLLYTLILLGSLFFVSAIDAAITVTDQDLMRIYQVNPGETIEGTIQLKNFQKREIVNFSQQDLYYEEGQKQSYIDVDENKNPKSNAAWVQFVTPEEATLEADSEFTFKYKIKVPDDEDLQGSYWSTIMVEPQSAYDPDDDDVQEGIRILTKVRYAINIVTNIGDGVADIKVSKHKIESNEEETTFSFQLINDDIWLYRVAPTLQLYDQQGQQVKNIQGGFLSVFPKTERKASYDFSDLEEGDYTAIVLLEHMQKESVQGVQYNISL